MWQGFQINLFSFILCTKRKQRWWRLVYEATLSKERYLRTWSCLFCIQARDWVMELHHHKWASSGSESSTASSLFEYLQAAISDCLRSKVEKPLGVSHLARFLLLAIDAECSSDCLWAYSFTKPCFLSFCIYLPSEVGSNHMGAECEVKTKKNKNAVSIEPRAPSLICQC